MRHLFWIVPGLFFFGFLLLLASESVPPIDQHEAAALLLMEQPPLQARGAHNAFALTWSARYRVPPDAAEAVFAEDAARLLSSAADAADDSEGAGSRYPPRHMGPDACGKVPLDCLAALADPATAQGVRAQQAEIEAFSAALASSDHLVNRLPWRFDMPSPDFAGIGRLQVASHALRYLDGDLVGALSGSCRDFATWRRLRARTDLLVADMVSMAFAAMHAELIAELWRHWPAGDALPFACDAALSEPDDAELDQCDVWRGEFRQQAALFESLREQFAEEGIEGEWYGRLLVNERKGRARLARRFASLCPGQPALGKDDIGVLDWAFDPLGSYLADLNQVDYPYYRKRAQAFIGLLQALRSAHWLGKQPDRVAAWNSRPPSLLRHASAITFDHGSGEVVQPQAARRGETAAHWRLALPGMALIDDP